jgi:hypothetical protein
MPHAPGAFRAVSGAARFRAPGEKNASKGNVPMSEAASRSRRLVSTRVCVSVIVRSIPAVNPEQTIIRAPDDLPWVPSKGYPERSVDRCTLTGPGARVTFR